MYQFELSVVEDNFHRPKNDRFYYPKPPRKTMNPFMCFVKEEFSRFRKIPRQERFSYYPNTFLTILIRKWRIMKMMRHPMLYVYRGISRKDSRRYMEQIAEWRKQFKGRVPRILRRHKNPDEPKHTRNGFMFYQKDHLPIVRKEFPSKTHHELLRELGRRWRLDLTREEKRPYVNQSNEDKLRYKAEIATYRRERKDKKLALAKSKKDQRLEELRRRAFIRKCEDRNEVCNEFLLPIFYPVPEKR